MRCDHHCRCVAAIAEALRAVVNVSSPTASELPQTERDDRDPVSVDRSRSRLWAALIAPMLWLVAAAWVDGSTSAALDRPLFVVWIVLILLVSVPISLRLLVDMFKPELTGAPVGGCCGRSSHWRCRERHRLRRGREDHRFLTCGDFAVAGSAEPETCVQPDS